MRKSSMIVGGIILAAILIGVFVFVSKKQSTPTSATTSSPTTGSSTQAAATITYSGSGFSPETITVKSGDTVTIKNASADDLQLDSNPHPVHTDDTDLNVGLVSPGQTKTFMVTKKGSFGFHNHLSPNNTGKIVIE